MNGFPITRAAISHSVRTRLFYETTLVRHRLDEPGLALEASSILEIIERCNIEERAQRRREVAHALDAAECALGVVS